MRDLLIGRQVKDYDFVVRGVPIKALQACLGKFGSVNLVGKTFGVLKFTPSHSAQTYDIALPRTEFTLDHTGAYRDFSVQSDYRMAIENDLARRDFTINAIAYNLDTATLVDPWGGMKDLSARVIRAVGDPHTRFREDYTRMLRALRFSCQLEFAIVPHTLTALEENISHLNDTIKGERIVPYELISREMIKSFVADILRAFDYFDSLGVFAAAIPEIDAMKKCPQPKKWHSEGDVWTHTRLALKSLTSAAFAKEFGGEKPDALLILATLLHDIGKPLTIKTPKKDRVDRIRFDGHDRVGAGLARRICERLKTASVEGYSVDPEAIHWLIAYHLVILTGDIRRMKNTTIEKYFFRDPYLGSTLQKLTFADGSGSHTALGKKGLDGYRLFKKRVRLLKKTSGAKKELPKAILNGDEIMKACAIGPGARVGELLRLLREEQLSGRIKTKSEARIFVKSHSKKMATQK